MKIRPTSICHYLMAAQAQKHVTHNEAIRMLDALVNLTALSRLSTPPSEREDGGMFIVGASAAADWVGWEENIAACKMAPRPSSRHSLVGTVMILPLVAC